VRCESTSKDGALREAVASTLRSVAKLTGGVELLPPGHPAERRQGDRGRTIATFSLISL
jgi:hypothetical protein